jgi:hypothetical protein
MSESTIREGRSKYIRIDNDLEHIIRWEAEGVTGSEG